MRDPVFEPGDVMVCKGTCCDYDIREGKEYTVIEYDPPFHDSDARFTFPAYVTFNNDRGRQCVAHACRFKPKE